MLTNEDRGKIRSMELYDFMVEAHLADIEIYNSWVRLKCNPSVNIRKGRSNWQDFSASTDHKSGDAISLLTDFLGYSFKEAVDEIKDYLDGNPVSIKEHNVENLPKREFKMPKKSKEYPRAVKNYLVKTRHIPKKLVDMLMDGGYVYMTDTFAGRKKIHNVVFTTPSHKFYEIRGCNTEGQAFHRSLALTPDDCLIFPGTTNSPKKIYITEAAIDAISLLAIHGLQHQVEDAWYVGLGGISKQKPLEYLAEKHKNAEIIIAVDNDKAGEQMREKYAGVYKSIIPKNKDWNDDLCEMDKKKSKEVER